MILTLTLTPNLILTLTFTLTLTQGGRALQRRPPSGDGIEERRAAPDDAQVNPSPSPSSYPKP